MPSTDPILAAAAALREQHAELAAQRAVVDHQIAAIETCLTNLEAVYPAAKAPAPTPALKRAPGAPARAAAPTSPSALGTGDLQPAVLQFLTDQTAPVRFSEVLEAVDRPKKSVRHALQALVALGRIRAIGQTHARRYGLPGVFDRLGPAPAARPKPATPRRTPRASRPGPAPAPPAGSLATAVRQQLDHGASFTVADLVRKAKAAGEQTTPEAVQAVLDQFVADGRVEKIPVGDGLRYRKRGKGGR